VATLCESEAAHQARPCLPCCLDSLNSALDEEGRAHIDPDASKNCNVKNLCVCVQS
jgi:hypothetical protein